jgi:hypothetical protein
MGEYFMDYKHKEMLTSIAKASMSTLPYVGGALNELLFDYRSRIAQQRINNFVENFLLHLSTLGIKIDENDLSSEEFNDIYFAVIKRVIDTKSEYKLRIFRDILISGITMDYQSDFKETFLDLVNRLDYIELEILTLYESTGREGSMDIEDGSDSAISILTSASYKERIIKLIRREASYLSTIEVHGRYEFYICDLISKSLLVDTKMIGNTYKEAGQEGLNILYITDFGKEFMKFIRYS